MHLTNDEVVRALSSVGRASALQAECRRFDPVSAHQAFTLNVLSAAVVQLVRISACHAEGRGFESRPLRHLIQITSCLYFNSDIM